ncbi:hypothetical protein [Enorma phocaeensis]|uniref:Uncharacterized protein n=1 Tax=Enorma phocaeensis TaxID=1871019 RepID=A0A921IS47_9ACTN|nr:hypothetical protein [Enorma phocaeensis]HJG36249.1 hypothetical protein [Enorma phocaeensis]
MSDSMAALSYGDDIEPIAVSLGVEALIAQSIARAVMNRWHLLLDARPVVAAAAAEDC